MMNTEVENPLLLFYRKHNISPVHQDLTDFNVHLRRREKLYRKLGLPPFAFSNKAILEVGPGGGYNALAYFQWGANVDFVEPNPKAQEELHELLGKYGIEKTRWNLYKDKVENYVTEKKYDIVIAEGVIPGLYNISEVIAKLSVLVREGGVIVVTCVDDISCFFEVLKRLVAVCLIQSIENFKDKVKILAQAFSTHLKTLKHASRPVEDWVTDQFLNPAIYANFFSIVDCIDEFGPDFEFLGSSPDMFTDYSWYKDLSYNSKSEIIKQFYEKRHMLLLWNLQECNAISPDNKVLFDTVFEFRKYAAEIENNFIKDNMDKIISILKYITTLTQDINFFIPEAINEAIMLLSDNNLNPEKVSQASKLAAAFGRGQQYVSMVKKFTD